MAHLRVTVKIESLLQVNKQHFKANVWILGPCLNNLAQLPNFCLQRSLHPTVDLYCTLQCTGLQSILQAYTVYFRPILYYRPILQAYIFYTISLYRRTYCRLILKTYRRCLNSSPILQAYNIDLHCRPVLQAYTKSYRPCCQQTRGMQFTVDAQHTVGPAQQALFQDLFSLQQYQKSRDAAKAFRNCCSGRLVLKLTNRCITYLDDKPFCNKEITNLIAAKFSHKLNYCKKSL